MNTEEIIPAFGSDAWLRRVLLHALSEARARIDRVLLDFSSKYEPSMVDFDRYVFVRVPRQQRKVCRLLTELGEEHNWINLSGDIFEIRPTVAIPGFVDKAAEYDVASELVDALRLAGIDAVLREHYRQ